MKALLCSLLLLLSARSFANDSGVCGPSTPTTTCLLRIFNQHVESSYYGVTLYVFSVNPQKEKLINALTATRPATDRVAQEFPELASAYFVTPSFKTDIRSAQQVVVVSNQEDMKVFDIYTLDESNMKQIARFAEDILEAEESSVDDSDFGVQETDARLRYIAP